MNTFLHNVTIQYIEGEWQHRPSFGNKVIRFSKRHRALIWTLFDYYSAFNGQWLWLSW